MFYSRGDLLSKTRSFLLSKYRTLHNNIRSCNNFVHVSKCIETIFYRSLHRYKHASLEVNLDVFIDARYMTIAIPMIFECIER